MGKIFKNLIISHTNDFPSNKNDKIKGWIENNGGIYTKELTSDVTHLIASKLSFKRQIPIVKRARHQRIRIIKLDWLEDSLMRSKPRRLDETPYYYEQLKFKKIKRNRRRGTTIQESAVESKSESIETFSAKGRVITKAKRIEKAGLEFDKACQVFEKEMDKVGFHPYADSNRSLYVISLIRRDILKSCQENYKLQVGQSTSFQLVQLVPGREVAVSYFPYPHPFSNQPVVTAKTLRKIQSRSCIHIREPWAQSLQLYESNQMPYTYACFIQYSQIGKTKSMTLELAPPGSTWDFAWDMFRKFFQKKCGKGWAEAVKEGPCEINLDGEQGEHFQYQLPEKFHITTINNKSTL